MYQQLFAGMDVNWNAVSAIGVVLAATVSILALLRGIGDSRARTRPYVVAEYRIPNHGFNRLDLVIRNVGVSPAREVSVSFDPPFVEDRDPCRCSRWRRIREL